ncbi:MAG: TIGR03745 family integrating conjugative element membrane protein [Klebsiella sp.]|uniref:TIGR03745 family integrating conjugative element membrane protein n=1 Tax=Klebsiella sp. TaxID=576 RepID=UPI0027F4F6CB|nr:TIGR03745 family integrating conjugative element membrane protein [Klebsiella sp.]EKT9718377.1 TIGR03745 family integrating conjugative element membrane protein [Klebsiella variicola]ELA0870036.1 TIGR03745 family integrating conjugative element membrane protein [Klebsiella variicola]ELA0873135.1 TIGR03745 family integrating conjugative element membrane protein [Klebsiella variicola]MDU2278674.1 TIGR03745 family integrating conjugative element membrane protein [Klebsiella sp.]
MRILLLLMLAVFNAFADLPTMEDPSRGQGQGIMETLQNYGFDIVVLLALAICAVGFLVVANNCIATYSEIQSGRKQWKDLGSMAGVGSILLVVIIWLLNQASDVL